MKIQTEVNKVFTDTFGRTPLTQRVQDILGEAIEISRFTDVQNLREETGDILSSTLQLCNECDWDAEELVRECLEKIEGRKTQYRSLGRKTKVALLGGVFNPPTLRHLEMAQYVLDVSRTFDEVWLMPCYQHMYYDKDLTSPKHRLEMCKILAERDGRIKVFDYEIKHELQGETFHLVTRLQDEDFAKHEYDFSLIIGMDNANDFSKWMNYKHLEKMIRFVVVPRNGVKRNESVNWYLQPPHIYLANSERPMAAGSSTEARKALLGFTSVSDFVTGVFSPDAVKQPNHSEQLLQLLDGSVLNYIISHNLYGTNNDPSIGMVWRCNFGFGAFPQSLGEVTVHAGNLIARTPDRTLYVQHVRVAKREVSSRGCKGFMAHITGKGLNLDGPVFVGTTQEDYDKAETWGKEELKKK